MSAPDLGGGGGLWPQLRAVLVGLHVLGVTLMATPSASAGLKRSLWKEPTVQQEFAAWNSRFRAIGIDWTQPEMEDALWDFAVGWEDVRGELVAPFKDYGRYLGVSQSWRMFVAPHRFPTRLSVDLQEDGAWRTLYEERSPEHTWLARVFDHDRMRSAIFRFGWPQYKKSWEGFSRWVAARAAVEFPDATRIRTRMFKYKTLSPEEVRAGNIPEGKYQQEHVIALEPLRAEGATP